MPPHTAVSSAAMAVCGGMDWNGGFSVAPSGYGNLVAADVVGMADKLLSASGSEDPAAFTSNGGDKWDGFTITLTPEAGGGVVSRARRHGARPLGMFVGMSAGLGGTRG